MPFQDGYSERKGKGERCSKCGKPINGKMIVGYVQVHSKTLSKETRGNKIENSHLHPDCKKQMDETPTEIKA